MKNRHKQLGTTLLEILIYFGILAVVLMVAMSFAIQILSVNQLSNNYSELQTNLNFITEKIVQKIHVADSINLDESVFDSDTGILSLNFSDITKSPTKFYLENKNIYIKEGADQAIKLNSSLIKIDKLNFHKVSYAKSPDQIIININATPLHSGIANVNKEIKIHLLVNLRKI